MCRLLCRITFKKVVLFNNILTTIIQDNYSRYDALSNHCNVMKINDMKFRAQRQATISSKTLIVKKNLKLFCRNCYLCSVFIRYIFISFFHYIMLNIFYYRYEKKILQQIYMVYDNWVSYR